MSEPTSITEWAESVGLSLEQALEGGVSEDDNGTVHIPRDVWKWLRAQGRV
jgi:hypothetical protein